jgi:hypothetical protein
MNGDHDLRTWFDLLRAADRERLPPFAAGVARPARRVPRLAWTFAVLLLVVVFVSRRPARDPLPLEAIGRWQSPTASLLDVPQSPLMTTVPEVTR